MSPLIGLFLVVLAILAVGYLCGSRPASVFVVRVRGGVPRTAQGKVTQAFLSFIAQLCREESVSSGEIRGVPRGRQIALWFSGSIPDGARQRLRNWWGISGWRI
jgi:hypothetical protein